MDHTADPVQHELLHADVDHLLVGLRSTSFQGNRVFGYQRGPLSQMLSEQVMLAVWATCLQHCFC